MRLRLVAVGRLKSGPERLLFDRYWERAGVAGRPLGFHLALDEIDESRARRAPDRCRDEGERIARLLPPGADLVVLDETGDPVSSDAFARMLGTARDAGAGELALAIGGPDGLDDVFRKTARRAIAFGAMTWPHQLVRVMAAEQIYRAMTILAGHPYHRA